MRDVSLLVAIVAANLLINNEPDKPIRPNLLLCPHYKLKNFEELVLFLKICLTDTFCAGLFCLIGTILIIAYTI